MKTKMTMRVMVLTMLLASFAQGTQLAGPGEPPQLPPIVEWMSVGANLAQSNSFSGPGEPPQLPPLSSPR